jgi:hypothetical protein
MDRPLKVATPDTVLTGVRGLNAAPAPLSAIETDVPLTLTGFPAASRTWTAAPNVAPLATLAGGCEDIASWAGAPGASGMVPDVAFPEPLVNVTLYVPDTRPLSPRPVNVATPDVLVDALPDPPGSRVAWRTPHHSQRLPAASGW